MNGRNSDGGNWSQNPLKIPLENNSLNLSEPRALPSRKEKIGDDASPLSWTKGYKQYHKINGNRFFVECFTANVLQFFTKKRQKLAFGWPALYWPSNS